MGAPRDAISFACWWRTKYCLGPFLKTSSPARWPAWFPAGSSKWKGSGRLGQQDNQLELRRREIAGHINRQVARPSDGLPCHARLAQAEILVVQPHRDRTGRLGHMRQPNAG